MLGWLERTLSAPALRGLQVSAGILPLRDRVGAGQPAAAQNVVPPSGARWRFGSWSEVIAEAAAIVGGRLSDIVFMGSLPLGGTTDGQQATVLRPSISLNTIARNKMDVNTYSQNCQCVQGARKSEAFSC